MPMYSYKCKKCGKDFETLCKFEERNKQKCEFCGSKKLEMDFGSANFSFNDPKGTSKFDSFSYRAGYNMEKAKAERRRAMDASGGVPAYPPNMYRDDI